MVSTNKELILRHIKHKPGILNRRELHRRTQNVSSIAFRLSPVFSCFLRCQGRKQNWFCIGEFSQYFFPSFSFSCPSIFIRLVLSVRDYFSLLRGHFTSVRTENHWGIKRIRGTQRQFSENICSEDDLRSRIFGTSVVKFLACLTLPGFLNKMVSLPIFNGFLP